jgi:integrase
VFTTMRGKPQSRRNVLRAVYNVGDNLGLNGEGVEPIGVALPPPFVHTVAFEQGLSAPEVAKLARHANPRMTLGMYAGLTHEGREKTIAKLVERAFGR